MKNWKELEELSKNPNLVDAYFVGCFRDWWCSEKDYEYEEDIPKAWDELTDEEKDTLFEEAKYWWLKDGVTQSITKITDCVMEMQGDILADDLDKDEFINLLCD